MIEGVPIWNLTLNCWLMQCHHLAASRYKPLHKLLVYIRAHCTGIYRWMANPNDTPTLWTKSLKPSSVITSMTVQMLVCNLSSHFWNLMEYTYKGLVFNCLCNASTPLAGSFAIKLQSSGGCMNLPSQTTCGILMAITSWSDGVLSFMVWLMDFVKWCMPFILHIYFCSHH